MRIDRCYSTFDDGVSNAVLDSKSFKFQTAVRAIVVMERSLELNYFRNEMIDDSLDRMKCPAF